MKHVLIIPKFNFVALTQSVRLCGNPSLLITLRASSSQWGVVVVASCRLLPLASLLLPWIMLHLLTDICSMASSRQSHQTMTDYFPEPCPRLVCYSEQVYLYWDQAILWLHTLLPRLGFTWNRFRGFTVLQSFCKLFWFSLSAFSLLLCWFMTDGPS